MSRVNFLCASALLVGAIIALDVPAMAVAVPSKADALRFQAKVDRIERNAIVPRRGSPSMTTELTESEVNAYLKYLAGPSIPTGIVDPELFAQGNGRVAGRAVVDLDAVRTQKVRAWSDPMGYLTGRLPISVEGILTTHDGTGRFELTSAEISGVTIPKTLLQELLSYYSRTPDTPSGINMDDPFALPDAIREIRIGQGSAVIVQ
jgi:hypothetical protein